MENAIKILAILFVIFFTISCEEVEKDVKSYSPKVETKNVEIMEDGNVWVSYDIVSNGLSDLEWVGCSVDTVLNPSVESMQKLASYVDGSTYYSVYAASDFDKTKKYYFRPFANNMYGLSFGNNFELDSIAPIPVTIPCNLTLNRFNFLGSTYQYNFISSSNSNGWEVTGNASAANVYFIFYKLPKNGVYKTTGSNIPEKSNEVSIRISKFNTYYVLADAKVYVEEIDDFTLEITVCEGLTNNGSGTAPFFTRFQVEK